MKKIIALILALCCVFAVVSCGGAPVDDSVAAQVENVKTLFKTSIPTKTITTTTHSVGSTTLTSVATLTTGMVNGKDVSIYVNDSESLAEVSNDLNPIKTTNTTIWFMEGKGTSTDKGKTWDAAGEDFGPTAGSIKIKIDASRATETTYDEATSTLVMKYSAENANNVLKSYLEEGQKIESDLTVTVVVSGGQVTGIKLEYKIPEHTVAVEGQTEPITVQETTVVINAVYEYDLQDVTLE